MSEKTDLETQPLLPKKLESSLEDQIVLTRSYGYFERKKRLRALKEYYDNLNELKALYEQDDQDTTISPLSEQCSKNSEVGQERLNGDRILSIVVFITNVLMLVSNLSASLLSGSYSVFSAFVDSAMDITSGVVIYCTIYAIQHTDKFKYPRGRKRLEFLALFICSAIMATASVSVVLQSSLAIVMDNIHVDVNLPTIILIGSRIVVKLVLMIACYRQNSPNSKVLALDQRNDVLTSIVALGGAFIGDRYWKYSDPIGAILVSSFISISWFFNALSYIPHIVGHRGSHQNTSRILRIAIQHKAVHKIDYVSMYHYGENATVELHVVLHEDTTLLESHTVVSDLQKRLQALDFVDMIFVHADYRLDGAGAH